MAKIYAHRGASGYAPENTMAAFELAFEMKSDGIELDVHLSKDGQIVVIHDETVDRVSDGKGYVRDFTFQELQEFNFSKGLIGSDFRRQQIPLLEDVLGLIKNTDMILNIEIKNDAIPYEGIEEKVVSLVNRYNVQDQIIYSSFNHYCLQNILALSPEAKTGLLYSCWLYEPWVYAKNARATAIHPLYSTLTPEVIESCHNSKISVNAWTINDRDSITKLIAQGVDGIITNFPDYAVR